MYRAMVTELKKIKARAMWSWAGFTHVWRTESSLMQWVVANVIFGVLAVVLPLSGAERGLLLMGGVMILAAECFNTALERVVDDIGLHKRDLAQQAKDCGSAGVAVTAVAVGIAWICVLIGLII